jgi:hypothetical protein
MRAAKDPIALELARRNKVLMPQLNLTKEERANLLLYMEAQDALYMKGEAPQAVSTAGGVTPEATGRK